MHITDKEIQELETLLDTKRKACPVSPIYDQHTLMFFSNTHRYSISYSDHGPESFLYIDEIGTNCDNALLETENMTEIIDRIKEHYNPNHPNYC